MEEKCSEIVVWNKRHIPKVEAIKIDYLSEVNEIINESVLRF